MEDYMQPKAPSHDGISPSPAAANSTSSIGPSSNSGRGNAHSPPSRPRVPLRLSSIHLRRLPSTPSVPQITLEDTDTGNAGGNGEQDGRRRSSSAPQPMALPTGPFRDIATQRTGDSHISSIREENPDAATRPTQLSVPTATSRGRRRRVSTSARSALGLDSVGSRQRAVSSQPLREYEPGVVDLLDVLDPEISTLSTLTNVQNSLFIPDLGSLLNRQPTYDLTRRTADIEEAVASNSDSGGLFRQTATREKEDQQADEAQSQGQPTPIRSYSISSTLREANFAVLPHDVSLDGWSEEDKAELDDYVRHMLHSRRSKLKRGLRGFGKYLQKPLGFFVTLYAVLITLFGLAWVLFLIGWIYVGERQPYIIHIIDSVLVALFALNGDLLAPFRARDTYHMVYIAHYYHLTWRPRRKRGLPSLQNDSKLSTKFSGHLDVETAMDDEHENVVLSLEQQKKLRHHQEKFSKSHSFYKPHETMTHTAFKVPLLIAVVILLDLHSCFQIALGACTWGISYKVRPQALTAVILSLSITCNIAAGITISVGDRLTRKKDIIERLSRQALTEEAMRKVKPQLAEMNLKSKKGKDEGEKTVGSPSSANSKDISKKTAYAICKSEAQTQKPG